MSASTAVPATQATTQATTQVYQVYIRASAQRIWDAITLPEWNQRFGYRAPSEFDLRPGGAFRSLATDAMRAGAAERGWTVPDVILDGEIIECDPPNKLVQTWRLLMDPRTAAEDFSTLTYEITEMPTGVSRLTVVHDLSGAPTSAALVAGEYVGDGAGGGWNWLLDDLKTLLETGQSFSE